MAEKLDDEIMNQLETILEKYEVASISKPKENHPKNIPMDFQTLNNAEVFIMDAELNYPVTVPYTLRIHYKQLVSCKSFSSN